MSERVKLNRRLEPFRELLVAVENLDLESNYHIDGTARHNQYVKRQLVKASIKAGELYWRLNREFNRKPRA